MVLVQKKAIRRSVMWIRIRSDPHSFESVDPDPEVQNEKKIRVYPTKFFFRRKLYFSSLNLKKVANKSLRVSTDFFFFFLDF